MQTIAVIGRLFKDTDKDLKIADTSLQSNWFTDGSMAFCIKYENEFRTGLVYPNKTTIKWAVLDNHLNVSMEITPKTTGIPFNTTAFDPKYAIVPIDNQKGKSVVFFLGVSGGKRKLFRGLQGREDSTDSAIDSVDDFSSRDGTPRIQHYLKTFDFNHIQRPGIQQLHQDPLLTISNSIDIEDDSKVEKFITHVEVDEKDKFGYFTMVYIPQFMNLLGTASFIQSSIMAAQSGLILALVQIVIGTAILSGTLLSLVALLTNGNLVLAFADFIIGAFLPPTEYQEVNGFVGWSGSCFTTNLLPQWNGFTFFTMFSIYLSGLCGDFTGVTMASSVRNPKVSIPKGSLLGIFTTQMLYVIQMIWFTSTSNRYATGNLADYQYNNYTCDLQQNCVSGCSNNPYMMSIVSSFTYFTNQTHHIEPIFSAGLLSQSMSSAMIAFISAPRMLQVI
ncbi:unnamed protein product [Oppiella nova]|uniref:Amino acid permease/ SLC12A domain-containing protein n=1 Tax=Oppiella nova TaxID=334625 RepID=A0A7R9QPS1_9ACAR|nr:unnamed protein product [Oppiella nova]CAG2169273.1 unnamed protein product [Oppiella nova]